MRVLFVVGAVMLISLFGVACSSTSNEQGSSSQESSEAEKSADSEDTKVENTQPLQNSAPSQQEFRLGESATFRSLWGHDYGLLLRLSRPAGQ
jgi:hypothetical protein